MRQYYNSKFQQFGLKPEGVDWNSINSQYKRFELLLDFIPKSSKKISLLDYGCGYGALYSYLLEYWNQSEINYIGYDISSEMINAASNLYNKRETIFTSALPNDKIDYCISSGIFNVKSEKISDNEWKEHVINELNKFNGITIKGFSFNMLTSFCDSETRKTHLYYSDPNYFLNYCLEKFSNKVKLVHGIVPFDFTISVIK